MANVKTLERVMVDVLGAPLVSKVATLKNNATGATITTANTDANGKYSFPNLDETVRYRVEVSPGGASQQVYRASPASAEFDHLYANDSLRTAAGAVVAFGGAVSMAGALTMNAQLNLGAGHRIDFPDELKDDKLDLYGGTYLLGIATGEFKHSVPTGSKHAFRVNAVEKFNVQGAIIQALTVLEQGGGRAYIGSFNEAATYPRAGTDLAVGWNFDSGPREITLWNTDTTPPTVSFVFRQLTGAAARTDLLKIVPSGQVLFVAGVTATPTLAPMVDTNTGVVLRNEAVELVANGLNGITVWDSGSTTRIGFFGATGTTKVAVTGSRGGNAALASLLTALHNYGLLTDSSTA